MAKELELSTVYLQDGQTLTKDVDGAAGNDSGGSRRESYVPKKGLTVLTAVFFVSGELVGSSVLALPAACAKIGWEGILILMVFGVVGALCGHYLAKCWLIIEERYPEMSQYVQDPYPEIGDKAFGFWGKLIVRFSVYLSLTGCSVVYVLLCADTLRQLLPTIGVTISLCDLALIICAVLVPLSWMESPKDFWLMAFIALFTTAVACVLGAIQVFIYGYSTIQNATHTSPSASTVFLNIGTILFSYGGAASFPTFQNDMKNRADFGKAVFYAFIVILTIFLIATVPSYIFIGDQLTDNFLDCLHSGVIVDVASFLIAVHLFMAFIIVFNPVAQALEMFAKTPLRFCWQRVLIRTGLVVFIAFVAESVPQFGKILNLVGGLTVSLSTFILPAVFYLKLVSDKRPEWREWKVSKTEKVLIYVIVVVSSIAGIFSTYSAVADIVSASTFVPPCYVSGMQ